MALRKVDPVLSALYERWKPIRKQALRDHGKLVEWTGRMHWHRKNGVPVPGWDEAARAADLEFPDVLGALWVEMEKLKPQIAAKVDGDREISRLRRQLDGEARRAKQKVAKAKTRAARDELRAEAEVEEGNQDQVGTDSGEFVVPEHWCERFGDLRQDDVTWALHFKSIPTAKLEEAPSAAAWTFLQMARKDDKLLSGYLTALKKTEAAVSIRFDDDASDVLQELREALEMFGRSVDKVEPVGMRDEGVGDEAQDR